MILARDIKIMNTARNIAISNNENFKIAAIMTYKRSIVSIGVNKLKTHPVQKQFGKNSKSIYLHAEIMAIVSSLNLLNKEDLKRTSLFVFRVKRPHKTSKEWVDGLACPCDGCKTAIMEFQIPRIVYSTNEMNEYCEWRP